MDTIDRMIGANDQTGSKRPRVDDESRAFDVPQREFRRAPPTPPIPSGLGRPNLPEQNLAYWTAAMRSSNYGRAYPKGQRQPTAKQLAIRQEMRDGTLQKGTRMALGTWLSFQGGDSASFFTGKYTKRGIGRNGRPYGGIAKYRLSRLARSVLSSKKNRERFWPYIVNAVPDGAPSITDLDVAKALKQYEHDKKSLGQARMAARWGGRVKKGGLPSVKRENPF